MDKLNSKPMVVNFMRALLAILSREEAVSVLKQACADINECVTELEKELEAEIHPESKKLYEEDKKTHRSPWALWQYSEIGEVWQDCWKAPAWNPNCKYRRKPVPHKHAELMALYAKDATLSETPWKFWEFKKEHIDTDWMPLRSHPAWDNNCNYRPITMFNAP